MSAVFLTKLVFAKRIGTYDLHQKILRVVPPEPRYLFRAEIVRNEETLESTSVVLLQSHTEPDVSRLGDDIREYRSATVPLVFDRGEVLRFFLRANVTRSRKLDREGFDRKQRGELMPSEEWRAQRGKRVALLGDDAQRDWLFRQAERGGFGIAMRKVRVAGEEQELEELRFSKTRPSGWARNGHTARHDGVDFEGLLRVEDPSAFMAAIRSGIGPAKAFGFGLLSVKRP